MSPRSLYGMVKRYAEQLAAFYEKRERLRVKSLRICMVADRCMENGKTLFSQYLMNCLERRPLQVWGDGSGSNEYIYSKDVARAAVCAVECPEVSGVFNIGTGVSTTVEALAQAFCQAFNHPLGIEYEYDKPTSPVRTCMDISCAEQTLGFVPQYSLQDALTDIRSYFM